MARAKILLADDHSLILEGIRTLLEDQHDVIGTASNGASLVKEALRLEPDTIVLDVAMPILNGIDAAREIRKSLPRVKFLFISMYSNAGYVRRALDAGASAYVLKSGAAEELLKAVEVVRNGGKYLSPALAPNIIQEVALQTTRSSRRVFELTSRQRQIMQLIAEGKQNKEIASLLFVSVRTVEFHRARLMARLGARSVAELIRCAIQEGLIAPTEEPPYRP
jgi:DNA-binding NarL/FixJ family response regulator